VKFPSDCVFLYLVCELNLEIVKRIPPSTVSGRSVFSSVSRGVSRLFFGDGKTECIAAVEKPMKAPS